MEEFVTKTISSHVATWAEASASTSSTLCIVCFHDVLTAISSKQRPADPFEHELDPGQCTSESSLDSTDDFVVIGAELQVLQLNVKGLSVFRWRLMNLSVAGCSLTLTCSARLNTVHWMSIGGDWYNRWYKSANIIRCYLQVTAVTKQNVFPRNVCFVVKVLAWRFRLNIAANVWLVDQDIVISVQSLCTAVL